MSFWGDMKFPPINLYSAPKRAEGSIVSPCIKKCKLENNVCTGCKRTIEHIQLWSTYSRQEKLQIIEEIKMAHAKLSPSSSKRWMNCPGSIALIETMDVTDKPSRHAAEGTVAHEIGEKCLRDDSKPSSFLGKTMHADGFEFTVTEEMVDAVEIYVSYINYQVVNCPVDLQVEVRCSLKSLEIEGLDGGTSDALLICKDEKWIEVVDYKHGSGVKVYPEHNTQAMQYALGALIKLEQEGVDISDYTVRITIVQPRTDWDNAVSTWNTTAGELYEWCNNELVPSALATKQPDAPLVPGDDQCQFCPAAGACPKLYEATQETALVDFDAIDDDDDDVQMPSVESLTARQKMQILKHEAMIKKFMAAVAAQVQQEIESGSLEYRNHFKLVASKTQRKLSDEASDVDFSPLLEILDHDEIFEFSTKSLLKIENAIKLKFKKQGIKGFAKAAKEELNKYCIKPKGGITLAPAADKRSEIAPPAHTDFKDLV